jgi:hypothetical protein
MVNAKRQAENTVTKIKNHLSKGGVVAVSNHMRTTYYDKRHIEMFRANGTHPEVQYGKKWLSIAFCKILYSNDVRS